VRDREQKRGRDDANDAGAGGAVIGVLARLLIPGRQPVSWWASIVWASIVVGVAAAFVGTGIAAVFGFRDTATPH
jgi:uncharacterized membrane protein YeaQ/YmgE (transglycosylase-associated protein family)